MIRVVAFLLLAAVSLSFPQKILEMKFEEVRLGTVVKALAKAVGKNVIIDPDAQKLLDTKVNVLIQKPINVNEAFNIILKEHKLIAVPVNRTVFKITKAGEVEVSVKGLDEAELGKIIDFLRMKVSPAAEIIIDKTLMTIYIRDEEKRVKKLGPQLKEYIANIVAEKRALEEEGELSITRVFYLKTISTREARKLIEPYVTKETVITEAPTFNALIITDRRENIEKFSSILSDFLVSAPAFRRPVTHIFYLKYITPEEFIRMIEPIRSEAGVILTGGAVRTGEKVTENKEEEGKRIQTFTPVLKEFNAVMITDYPEVIEKIKERFRDYISDVPVQIKIDARIMEVRKEILREIGINWNALLSNVRVPEFSSGGLNVNPGIGTGGTPSLSTTPGGLLTFTYQKGMLNALNIRLSAFEKAGLIRSISKPSVVTVNGQAAVIEQGQEIPYQSVFGTGNVATASIQFKKATMTLKVLPIVSPDGKILMDIDLKQDAPGQQTAFGPAINTRSVKTKVIVNDGDTVVLGGILERRKDSTTEGVPGLVRVPLLKWLFGQERFTDNDVELLIFITPTIVAE